MGQIWGGWCSFRAAHDVVAWQQAGCARFDVQLSGAKGAREGAAVSIDYIPSTAPATMQIRLKVQVDDAEARLAVAEQLARRRQEEAVAAHSRELLQLRAAEVR